MLRIHTLLFILCLFGLKLTLAPPVFAEHIPPLGPHNAVGEDAGSKGFVTCEKMSRTGVISGEDKSDCFRDVATVLLHDKRYDYASLMAWRDLFRNAYALHEELEQFFVARQDDRWWVMFLPNIDRG